MSYAALKKTAKRLSEQASFVVEITNGDEYNEALALMDELVDDYDNQILLIELLSKSIGKWEDISPDFSVFNQRIANGDPAGVLVSGSK